MCVCVWMEDYAYAYILRPLYILRKMPFARHSTTRRGYTVDEGGPDDLFFLPSFLPSFLLYLILFGCPAGLFLALGYSFAMIGNPFWLFDKMRDIPESGMLDGLDGGGFFSASKCRPWSACWRSWSAMVFCLLTNTLWLAGRVFVSVRRDREGSLMCVCVCVWFCLLTAEFGRSGLERQALLC